MLDHLGTKIFQSKMQYDKNIVIYDDCNQTLQWSKTISGCTGALEINTTAARTRTNGMYLSTLDAAPVISDRAGIRKYVSIPSCKNVKWIFDLCTPDITQITTVNISIYARLEGYLYTGTVKLNLNNGEVTFYESAGVYSSLGTGIFYIKNNQWVNIEYEIDLQTKKYKTLRIDDAEIDISSYLLVKGSSSTQRYLNPAIEIVNSKAEVASIYNQNHLIFGNFLGV